MFLRCKVTKKRVKGKRKSATFSLAFPSDSNFGEAKVTKKRVKYKKKGFLFRFVLPRSGNVADAKVAGGWSECVLGDKCFLAGRAGEDDRQASGACQTWRIWVLFREVGMLFCPQKPTRSPSEP